jgi:hypothetical protein
MYYSGIIDLLQYNMYVVLHASNNNMIISIGSIVIYGKKSILNLCFHFKFLYQQYRVPVLC